MSRAKWILPARYWIRSRSWGCESKQVNYRSDWELTPLSVKEENSLFISKGNAWSLMYSMKHPWHFIFVLHSWQKVHSLFRDSVAKGFALYVFQAEVTTCISTLDNTALVRSTYAGCNGFGCAFVFPKFLA